jgi:hypothetical protein
MSTHRLAGCLVLSLTVGACGLGPGGSPAATAGPGESVPGSRPGSPTLQPSIAPSPLDLASVVIPPDEPPGGMTLSDEGGGRAVLEQLPLFANTASQLQATPGFVGGQWSRFAGSASDFEASRGFILTWVVEYDSEANAKSALAILLTELESEDHYGWGPGDDAGLGDEGTCLDGENPQMGGLQETICVWRRAQLVMVVGGGNDNETPVQDDAAAMDARAAELLP